MMQVDLSAAARACEAGQFRDAEIVCRQALQQNPNDYRAMHLLGVVAGRAGHPQMAADLMRQSVALAPQVVSYRSNLATALIGIGELDEAEHTLNQALAIMPESSELHAKLATVLVSKGNEAQGIEHLQEALRLNPRDLMAHFNLAEVYRRQGNPDDAVKHLQTAIQIEPRMPDAYNNLAGILLDRGDFLEGLNCLQRLLQLRPRSAQAYTNLGLALRMAGETKQALTCYRNAVTIDPTLPQPWYDMATLHLTSGDMDSARECMEQLEKVAPDDPRVVIDRARMAERLGNLSEAAELIEPAFAKAPLNPNCATVYAVVQDQLGEKEKAASALEKMFDARAVTASEAIGARFSLGKIYDGLGSYDKAWENYSIGNAQRKKGLIHAFKPEGTEQQIDRLLETFTPDRFANYPRATLGSDMPIFIVGMPRSGTSLVEQILSSHRDVYGAGELTDITNLVKSTYGETDQPQDDADGPFRIIEGDGSGSNLIPNMEDMTTEKLNDLAQQYLDKLSSVSGGAVRVTDKLPYNFMHIPWIRLLFPGVPIIHCCRHPIDTMLSCYFQNFTVGNEYTFDLEHLQFYYRQYQRLMESWRATVEQPIFEVQYEDLVSAPETHVRSMLDYCNLEWDEECMDFHRSKRVVVTASYQQVRQPIYTKSVNRWEHYREQLKDVVGGFSSAAER